MDSSFDWDFAAVEDIYHVLVCASQFMSKLSLVLQYRLYIFFQILSEKWRFRKNPLNFAMYKTQLMKQKVIKRHLSAVM